MTRIKSRDAAGAFTSKSEFVYDYASRRVLSREFTYTAGAWAQQSETRRVFEGLDVVRERDEMWGTAGDSTTRSVASYQLTRVGNIGGILARTKEVSVFLLYDGFYFYVLN